MEVDKIPFELQAQLLVSVHVEVNPVFSEVTCINNSYETVLRTMDFYLLLLTWGEEQNTKLE